MPTPHLNPATLSTPILSPSTSTAPPHLPPIHPLQPAPPSPTTSPPPPLFLPCLLACTQSEKMHLRPCKPKDIAQVHAIFTRNVLHTVSVPEENPATVEKFWETLEEVMWERLVFIVVYMKAREAEVNVTGNEKTREEPDTTGEVNREKRVYGKTEDLILSFIYALPFRHFSGVSSRTVATGTYINPSVRKLGIGS
ncbi:hypothetical protein EX30DRAFT_389124 [Ascodesmis nigricans]|uniref:Uncharacterized protein n=1 Tax=Ascodesmis nigricans TaxID=341454 RepID=A0A4S2MJ38_9PEZI|nr:hypothetical protein EX30DRAFT_389124 [Ascodesmis nigricans]